MNVYLISVEHGDKYVYDLFFLPISFVLFFYKNNLILTSRVFRRSIRPITAFSRLGLSLLLFLRLKIFRTDVHDEQKCFESRGRQ